MLKLCPCIWFTPKFSKSYRRKWTGLVVAYRYRLPYVTPQQVGLSSSYRFLLITQNLASFQMKRD